ncbi:unnamed protein product, partial [marine sediment metagenome]
RSDVWSAHYHDNLHADGYWGSGKGRAEKQGQGDDWWGAD